MTRATVVSAALLACSAALVTAQESTAEDVTRRAQSRRAAEAVIWSMPAVNFELMYDALVKAGGDWNEIVLWSRLPDWRNQTLTPNPDVVYLMPFYDTRKGPVVLEIPPADGGASITGSVDEGWQTALEDVGPAGADKGKGGRYLILPPGHTGKVPAGFIPLRSSTYTGFALLRSNVASSSDADVAKAVAYGRRVKLYPLAQAAKPPTTRFVDASGVMYDATIPWNVRYFETLHRFVQREPWLERDRIMIDYLRSIGIEKGKPFAPDATTAAALTQALAEARAWTEARYEGMMAAPYFAGTHWAVPVSPEALEGLQTNFGRRDSYPVSDRGAMYTFGFFSAKHLGEGQFYLFAITDGAGKPLDGGRTYRLTVPPRAPVKLYWSATAYDRETHALIRDVRWSSRASTTRELQRNADGSVTLWFGPAAPPGKESNWVPTRAGGRFEVLFRLYGPEKSFFDKAWTLPDLEEVR